MAINWSKLKANKNCYSCNVSNNIACDKCECVFMKKNYRNYSYYDDDFGWLSNKDIKKLMCQQRAIMDYNYYYFKGYYDQL